MAIHTTLAAHKTAALTYYHQLKDYVSSLTDAEAVSAVAWGQPLEGDYLTEYNTAITSAQRQLQIIISRIGGGSGA